MTQPVRKIIHIDMDAFYASVEQRDRPELKGKPVAVGGDHPRGVVAAASYEARKFGVRSAMSSVVAKKKCPNLVFIFPRFEVYHSVSKQLIEIFHDYTDLVEPLSLDEAFLDVTENKKDNPSATIIAKEIKNKIKEKVNLTASAGVSVNKFLAKIASDFDKPDGLFVIKPEETEGFVEKLPIEKFYGVGKATAKKMHKLGINNGYDLKKFDKCELIKLFGKVGSFYYDIARGVDNRPVDPERLRKSISAECTFDYDLVSKQEMVKELISIEKILFERLRKASFTGRTLSLKVKFDNFDQITRSKSLQVPLDKKHIHQYAVELTESVNFGNRGVRLLGLTVSNPIESDTSKQLKINF